MQLAETHQDVLELEQLIVRLASGHEQLAEAVEEQRRAIRRADPAAMAAAGGRIESVLGEIGALEGRRREVCGRLGPRLGLAAGAGPGQGAGAAGRVKLETIVRRIGGRAGQRLAAAAAQLSAQMDRVRWAGRVNEAAAGKLTAFFGGLLGQIGRFGRETGCYDARGRRAVARESLGMNCFSAVG